MPSQGGHKLRSASKQPKLSFAAGPSSSSSSTRARPLSFTPSFTLAPGNDSAKQRSTSPLPPPLPRVDSSAKGKQRRIEPDAKGSEAVDDPPGSPELTLWCDKHAPRTLADLAVHKNKSQDVHNWLRDAFSGNPKLAKYRRLLVLTGPAGSGKTATLKALSAASELDFEILEWNTQSALTEDAGSFAAPLSERFSDFLARAGRYPTLSLSSDQAVDPVRSPSTSKGAAATHRRVILVEDLPNVHHLATKVAFNAALDQYLSRPLSAEHHGSQRVDNCPIVLILSENTPKEDDERWAGDSGGNGWRDRLGAIMDVRTVLEEGVRKNPAVSEIRFNPVAPTILMKGLRRIVDLEFPQPTTRARKSAGDAPAARPSVQTIQAVADSGTGDIRAAVNCLQFLCSMSAPDAGTKRGSNGKTKATSKTSAKARLAAKQLSMITGRETSLELFHAVGKILYNKRYGDPGQEAEEQKLRAKAAAVAPPELSDEETDDEELASMQVRLGAARRSLLGIDDDETGGSRSRLPSHYEPLQRRESRVDVQSLWTDLPVDPIMFQIYLHQNYPAFTTDIDECCGIVSGISDADSMRCLREEYRHASLLSHYSFLITVHSTLLHLPSPVPRRNQKFAKAAFWEVRDKTREMDDLIDDAKQWLADRARGGGDTSGPTNTRGGGLFGRSNFQRWQTGSAEDLLDANRCDAGLGDEGHSSLMRADRQTLATEIIPLLVKIQGGSGGSNSKLPDYFSRVARMRFDRAGVSDMAERQLEEHEIEHRLDSSLGAAGGDDDEAFPSQAAAVDRSGSGHPAAAMAGQEQADRVDEGAGDGEEVLFLSDDDIEEFS